MNIPRTTYNTTSHSLGSLWGLLYIAGSVSMACMFVAIWLGAPVLVGMAALLVPMVIVFGLFAGDTEFRIDENGLFKHVRPYLSYKLWQYEKTERFGWDDIRHFKTGKDMNRSLQEYEYLEITFLSGTTWQLTDQKSTLGFTNFKLQFLQAVNTLNNPLSPKGEKENAAPINPVTAPTEPTQHQQQKVKPVTVAQTTTTHRIKQQTTFYESIWGKVFFIVLLAFAVFISGFLIFYPQYLSLPTAFRMLFVILPGLVYVGWRVWKKPA